MRFTTLDRYLFTLMLRNVALALLALVTLFLAVDFLDRFDNLSQAGASLGLTLSYFGLKIPQIIVQMLPMACLIGTTVSLTLLSASSEITALRTAGMRAFRIAYAPLCLCFIASGAVFLISEYVTPRSSRLVREIYNIDIQGKDKSGHYSQENFWWRQNDTFYDVRNFDSRSKTMLGITALTLDDDFYIKARIDAKEASYADTVFGWFAKNVIRQEFRKGKTAYTESMERYPLDVYKTPESFFDQRLEPSTMSTREMRRLVNDQKHNNISIAEIIPLYYEKFSFPFACLFCALLAIPICLRHHRSVSIAREGGIALVLALSYYVVHSLAMSLGKAEVVPALLSAWAGNAIFGLAGGVLLIGADSGE